MHAVEEEVDRREPARQERAPPPVIVLRFGAFTRSFPLHVLADLHSCRLFLMGRVLKAVIILEKLVHRYISSLFPLQAKY